MNDKKVVISTAEHIAKVYSIDPILFGHHRYVIHADYRALEERFRDVCVERDQWREELASLRARVGELVEARDHLYLVETTLTSDDEQIKASDRFQAALRDMQ